MPVSNQTIIKELLYSCIKRTASQESLLWLDAKLEEMKTQFSARQFFLSFSASFRFFSKKTAVFQASEIDYFHTHYPSWNYDEMADFEIARLLIYLNIPSQDKSFYFQIVNRLFSSADMRELAMLYRHMMLYPYPDEYIFLATEGVRTNIKSVFESLALKNAYPSIYFNQQQWNQMILKCIFNQCNLQEVVGLEKNANPELAISLSDYAHERWAANRDIQPDLWQLVAQFELPNQIEDYKRLLESGNDLDAYAGGLACIDSGKEHKIDLLKQYPNIYRDILEKPITWSKLSYAWQQMVIQK
jgi:hypothetical protein